MLKFAPLLLLLIGGPALAINDAQLDAVIQSCSGAVCSCPAAKVARIDKSVCGREPEWVSDNSLAIDANGNTKKFDKYNKCLREVLDENIKIDRYNGIFDNCQRSHASDEKTKFTNLPSRPIDTGDGKTLNEQVQDVKVAERAQEQALREQEAARQAPTVQPQQASTSPNLPIASNGRHVLDCVSGIGGNHQHLLCLTVEPATFPNPNMPIDLGMNSQGDTIITFNGLVANLTGNEAIYQREISHDPGLRHYYSSR
jgi:hypothetical protein